MFHNTHAYLASKLYNSQDSLLIVGSILPDLAVTGVIEWNGGLHGSKEDQSFYKYIQKNYPNLLDLAKGVHAHNIIDDFTHIDYQGKTGYAFQNTDQLASKIKEYYNLDDEKSKGIAHNYIESAVEILVLQERISSQNLLEEAIQNADKQELAELLSKYFKKDKNEFVKSISLFFNQFTRYNFAKEEKWVLFWQDLESLLSLKDIGGEKRLKLINEALKMVNDTYQDFLNYSIDKGSNKLEQAIENKVPN